MASQISFSSITKKTNPRKDIQNILQQIYDRKAFLKQTEEIEKQKTHLTLNRSRNLGFQ